MPRYMLLLGGVDPARSAQAAAEDYAPIMQKYIAWTQKLREGGHLVETHKLKDKVGRKVAYKDGRVVDGPFVETKETIGGYYILEAKDFDEACALARGCPTVADQHGVCEVRLIEF